MAWSWVFGNGSFGRMFKKMKTKSAVDVIVILGEKQA